MKESARQSKRERESARESDRERESEREREGVHLFFGLRFPSHALRKSLCSSLSLCLSRAHTHSLPCSLDLFVSFYIPPTQARMENTSATAELLHTHTHTLSHTHTHSHTHLLPVFLSHYFSISLSLIQARMGNTSATAELLRATQSGVLV